MTEPTQHADGLPPHGPAIDWSQHACPECGTIHQVGHGFSAANPPKGTPQQVATNILKAAVGMGVTPDHLAEFNAAATVDVLKEQFPLTSHILEGLHDKLKAGYLSRINTLLNSPS